MTYLLVGIGGILGSFTRYVLGRFVSEKASSTIPMGTVLVNISGAFFLGVFSASGVSQHWYHLIADGFLGAYTTFSTFMYEGFNLFQDREMLNAFIYIIFSLLFGIIGFALGMMIARYL
ncbi:MAG: fluoride efflux transporter CrcB [Candidatus Margulisiibacteriota bacterium]|nr:MAG: camphor resistance protein CrcB [Candidatus Margulisbacteria bacterium GWD2_39_127]OGI03605.1 MAG: camphor resistance protein CrcB [Candidatus Margulisbacteria bacterium GWF2_38_17]OGI11109.1 MAG: camphor resistance protein CrcB [Candidatus Margulisbacteria bacterium GWE2_39_32]PZM78143.1 MAG: fluoride efflux transporter CrcB [Candidatus Margulisiibacteriota bacterium]HAR64383.1 fluoride efflux transporter CrcB [Candidatus Margulisiibacteriota bacterium]